MTIANKSSLFNQNPIAVSAVLGVCLSLVACDLAVAPPETGVQSIRWSDGDSGEIDGVRFRLVDVDAPETGPVGSSKGARCTRERDRGRTAKVFMEALTENAALSMRVFETDQYGRLVIGLDADGENVITAAIEAGHLKDWPHENGRALTAKPDWCVP